MVSATALLSPVHLPGQAWAGCRSSGFGDQTWGEDWDGLHGNSLKGLESGATTPECVCRGSLGHLRGKEPLCGWHAREGVGPTITLFFPTCALRWQDTAYRSSRSSHKLPLLLPHFRSGCELLPFPSHALGTCMSHHHC